MPKFTHPHEFEKVKTALEAQGLQFAEASVSWIPQNTIKVEGENAEKLLKMMDSFDDLDDVQDVYSNYEMDEEEMAKIG
ncbi:MULTISPECIES: YebC/PmpR family DNA-binding transcriptional regulator [Paenibacillus]|uniref:TACO1/YebC-like second and third domain-containing protein n=1 Tax=Paenibacillus validus TaxID=44253 RepID=A0A7X2ZC14_9BACL|nr:MULTISPECIES: YebC/PmpR family DNA-binding transcriptional regulator [Paenibacillus]MUG71438.1 hypothetical protein [Paenibacillus validus]